VATIELDMSEECDPGFSSSVHLQAGKSNEAKSTKVVAWSSQYEFSVEVYIAPIAAIRILTTARKLTLLEAETVEVQAFDEQENVFSSLDGLRFQWRSTAIDGQAEKSPLKIHRLSETRVMSTFTEGLQQQESFGQLGYKVQITGSYPGVAQIHAKLLGMEGKNIQSSVKIDVVEPLTICPPSLIALRGSSFRPQPLIRTDKTKYSSVDSTKYEWRLVSGDVVSVDSSSGLIHSTDQLGKAKVDFLQKGYSENHVSLNIRVIEPTNILLWLSLVPPQQDIGEITKCHSLHRNMFPGDDRLPDFREWQSVKDTWILTRGEKYYVMISLAGNDIKENEVVSWTDSMTCAFNPAVDTMGLLTVAESQPEFLPPNVKLFHADSTGLTNLGSSFEDPNHKFQFEMVDIQITDPVELLDKIIRVPYDETVVQSFAVNAIGGTGHYDYSVTDPSLIHIYPNSNVMKPKEFSKLTTSFLAMDKFNHANKALGQIVVTPPAQLVIEPAELYVIEGTEFALDVQLFDSSGFNYTNCTAIGKMLKWRMAPGAVKAKSERKASSSICSSKVFIAAQPGTTFIRVKLSDTLDEVSAKVVVMGKIRINRPGPNAVGLPVAIVAVGSTSILVVSGGFHVDTFAVIDNESGDIINEYTDWFHIALIPSERHQVRSHKITCHQTGHFRIRVQQDASMELICSEPVGGVLAPVETQDGCESLSQGYLSNEGSLKLTLKIHDAQNREFTDVDPLTWTTSSKESQVEKVDSIFERILRSEHQFVGPVSVTVDYDERIKISYQTTVWNDISFSPHPRRSVVVASSANLPPTITLLNILGGAEDLVKKIRCDIGSVFTRNGRTIYYSPEQMPLYDQLDISCEMPCLVGSSKIVSSIHFRRLAMLKISGPEMARVGDSVTLSIQAFDSSGNPFSGEMHNLIDVKLTQTPLNAMVLGVWESSCVGGSDDLVDCDGQWQVSIESVQSAEVSIVAHAFNSSVFTDHKISVFDGIQILPRRHQQVEPGVEFRLRRIGGPFTHSNQCLFFSGDPDVASIKDQAKGVLFAKYIGTTSIKVSCVEKGIVIDSDEIQLTVDFFKQVAITPSLIYLVQDHSERVHVSFPVLANKLLDFDAIFRSYKWEIENKSVATIVGPPSVDEFSIWVKASATGSTTIKLVCDYLVSSREPLIATAEIEVILKLQVTTPVRVFLPRWGDHIIKTNLGNRISFSVAQRNEIVQLQSGGHITASDNLGEASVYLKLKSEYKFKVIEQVVSVLIHVRDVAYIGTQPIWPDLIIQEGSSILIDVGLYDEQGNQFTSPFSTVQLDARAGNDDVASVEIITLPDPMVASTLPIQVRGKTSGYTSVALWIKSGNSKEYMSPREDYFRVQVSPAYSGWTLNEQLTTHGTGYLYLLAGSTLEVHVNALTVPTNLTCFLRIGDIAVWAMYTDSKCLIPLPKALNAVALGVNASVGLSVGASQLSAVSFPFVHGFSVLYDSSPVTDTVTVYVSEDNTMVLDVVSADIENIAVVSQNEEFIVPGHAEKVSPSVLRYHFNITGNITSPKMSSLVFIKTTSSHRLILNLVLKSGATKLAIIAADFKQIVSGTLFIGSFTTVIGLAIICIVLRTIPSNVPRRINSGTPIRGSLPPMRLTGRNLGSPMIHR